MTLQPFDYLEPKSLDEANAALGEYGSKAALLAGGTDLLVMMKSRIVNPKVVVNLKRIPGLGGIAAENGNIRLGTLTSFLTITNSTLIRARLPALAEAAGWLGSVQTRYQATVGGNQCRAAPSADSPPALIVLGAQVHLVGLEGARTVPLDEFFTGPGQTILAPGEILTEIRVPTPTSASGAAYLRHSVRPLMDLAIVNVAAAVVLDEEGRSFTDVRIALGAVAPTPMRAQKAEAALRGQAVDEHLLDQAAELAAGEAQPISDVRSSAEYRRAMVRLLTRRALDRALARANG
ncbi:MAG: xanthine dehydrogenase family protein subunit M [Anaerolineales bacterium]|jgi:carbon-monoxide dehydrogenase medium subunit|nr:xanthine dehydrogenase family protein subunit M [Anaerolineales bacterium]|tara:strand:+ start:29337 stop:30212 length:876 start_codon:yes stop_codon:yes gene_type:complete